MILETIICGVLAIGGGYFFKEHWAKKVLIYGIKATGKTSFYTYCVSEKIIETYTPTLAGEFKTEREKTDFWNKFKFWTKNWKLIDSAGQDRHNKDLTEMKKKIQEADKILYFFRADKLISDLETRKDTLRTIKANILQYKDLFENKLILVATHIDLIPSFSRDMAAKNWEEGSVLQEVIKLSCKHRIEYVSLAPDYIESSVTQLLDLIKE